MIYRDETLEIGKKRGLLDGISSNYELRILNVKMENKNIKQQEVEQNIKIESIPLKHAGQGVGRYAKN